MRSSKKVEGTTVVLPSATTSLARSSAASRTKLVRVRWVKLASCRRPDRGGPRSWSPSGHRFAAVALTGTDRRVAPSCA